MAAKGKPARILTWAIAGLGALAAVLVAATLIVTRTQRFRDFVRERLVDYLHSYRGQIALREIDGSIWGDLTVRDVTVLYQGSVVVSIPAVRLRFSILPILAGYIDVTRLELNGPRIRLARVEQGQWNLLAALSPKTPAERTSASGAYTLFVRRLILSRADLEIVQSPSDDYRMTGIELEAMAWLRPSGIKLDVSRLRSTLAVPRLPSATIDARLVVDASSTPGTARIGALSLKTAASHLTITGKVDDLQRMVAGIEIHIEQLAASDVNRILPAAGLAQDLSGTIELHGDKSALKGAVTIAAGDCRASADIAARLDGGLSGYQVSAHIEKLDLRRLLRSGGARELPAGTIGGTIDASGVGTTVAGLTASADLHDTGLALKDMKLGDFSLRAQLAAQTASVAATLAQGKGRLRLGGTLEVKTEPTYRLMLTAENFDPRALGPATAKVPAAAINLRASIKGSGVATDRIDAAVGVRFSSSKLGPVKIDDGRIDARLSRGVARIDQASIKAADTTLDAQGSVALAASHRGDLRYVLAAESLSPWLALAGRAGNGRLVLKGSAEGNIERWRASGSGQLWDGVLEKYSVGHAAIVYDLATALARPAQGRLILSAANVSAGMKLKSIEATTQLASGPRGSQAADLSLHVIDTAARQDRLEARLRYRPQALEAQIAQLSLQTPAGTWRTPRPADLDWHNQTLEIHQFQLVSGDQSLSLDGRLAARGAQDLTARLDRLSLATVAAQLAHGVAVSGTIASQIRIGGTADAPVIQSKVDIGGLRVGGMQYAGLAASLAYSGERASGALTFDQTARHSLAARATMPVRIGWSRGFQFQPEGDLDATAQSSGIDLAFLDAVSGGVLQHSAGTLALDFTAHGPLTNPRPHGRLGLNDLRFLIKPLNVKVVQANAAVEIAPDAIRLVSLGARAADGELRGQGTVRLPAESPSAISLTFSLDRWPAIATAEYQATVGGSVACSGSLTAPRLDGRIEALHGLFRPDISLFSQQSLRPDPTIEVVRKWHPPTTRIAAGKTTGSAGGGSIADRVALAVALQVDRDNWIKVDNSAVEMQGNVRVVKDAGKQPVLSGEIHTVRGTLEVAGKDFTLSRGVITFTGGRQIDPSLDVVAQNQVQNYTISATVGGTALKPTLTLSSSPPLEQADILSTLMFGKPVGQLNGSQQQALQQQALGIAGGYAASQVGQAVAQALGLQTLGLGVSQSGVGFNRYVTQNAYISATQGTTNPTNRQASFNYYLTHDLQLNTSTSTNNGNQIELIWQKEY